MFRCITPAFLSVVLLACSSVCGAAAPRDPYQYFFNDGVQDFSGELERANQQGKRGLLVFFEAEDCAFCQRMKRDVLNQPEVQQYFRERFLSFSVDVESDAALVDFAGDPTTQSAFAVEQQRVRATPVIAFFDLDGNVIARHTGAVSGPQEFLWLGEFVADGHYQTTQFSRFKRQKRQQMH